MLQMLTHRTGRLLAMAGLSLAFLLIAMPDTLATEPALEGSALSTRQDTQSTGATRDRQSLPQASAFIWPEFSGPGTGGEAAPQQPFGALGVTADDGGAWEIGVHHSADPLEAEAAAEGAFMYERLASCGWNKRYRFGNAYAWEEDFKRLDAPGGGQEHNYLDTVDLQFYVGHGWPGGFTFANVGHDDSTVTPGDCNRAWGNGDNEWVALTSCQVLADSSLSNWAGCFNGSHLILGFKTNASAHLYPYNTQGYNFAKYLCQGYTVPQAWYKAADRSQPAGRVVRTLINELVYLNDRPMCGQAVCPLAPDSYDTDAWVQTHVAGSEPARYVNIQALGGTMPVFRTQPLSLAEAQNQYGNLGSVFDVSVTIPLNTASSRIPQQTGELWTSVSNGHELEMDPSAGLYGYIDLNTLWTGSQTQTVQALGVMAITPDDARQIADQFLMQNGLMPGDAQFYEVVSDTLSGGAIASGRGRNTVANLLANEQPVVWQVLYSRILTYTPPAGVNSLQQVPIEFSVVGPGAKQKVYVSTSATTTTVSSVLQSPLLGALGGWRRLQQPAVGADGIQAFDQVSILDPAQVYTLHQQLEDRVVINTPPIVADGRTILTHTVAYWEEAAGASQGELVPVYALSVSYTLQSQLVAVDFAYIPASPRYMRPFAQIESAPSSMVRVGEVVNLAATDASRTLAGLGYDIGLNFALGSGTPDDYIYDWYVTSVNEANKIGSGRVISYTVRPDSVDRAGNAAQTIILRVTDISSPNSLNSNAVATLTVQPRLLLPLIIKGL